MDMLQVRPSEFSSVRAKAVEDARQMQLATVEAAAKQGKDPPKYALLELIGKGSFGRVYKGKDVTSAATQYVAIKIIDIDESDTINPRNADSYSEFLKEVNALKLLGESKAKNINLVIDAIPVGKTMWMITEHCGGGSIATLMKPTAPGGLQEKWIIPILREVAEAIRWVHEAGIIHRDIKCANVLITEQGGVQLCDFGVAGIVEHKLDKRSTVIGTPHWMAPELFSSIPSYGKEVDIWAFGSMIYEISTGLPPNVANGIPYERLGNYLKTHVPRLEGGSYSNDLRDLVAFCLEELPSVRPPIEEVQKHVYIYNTSNRYPTSSLASLVRAFKLWEDRGGSRKSLFMMGGAQGPSVEKDPMPDAEWNFSTTAAFDQDFSQRDSTVQDLYEAYGTNSGMEAMFNEETTRPSKQQRKPSRRRPPPEALSRLPTVPLERIFDSNTLSSYDANSQQYYGQLPAPPISFSSDLPLRAESSQTTIRESLINMGGHDAATGVSDFSDMNTIKASHRANDGSDDENGSVMHNYSRSSVSDPADNNPNRRTQDWKFPSAQPATPAPASADWKFPSMSAPTVSNETEQVFVFPGVQSDIPRPLVTPAVGARPALVHHETEPVGAFSNSLMASVPSTNRLSMRESTLIDLDMGMIDMGDMGIDAGYPFSDPLPDLDRPSTASSEVDSDTGNPFEFEKHVSMLPSRQHDVREPSIYVTEEAQSSYRLGSANGLRDLAEVSDFSASDAESQQGRNNNRNSRYRGASFSDSEFMPPPPRSNVTSAPAVTETYTMEHFPRLPEPPSARALSGEASHEEMKGELLRMLGGLTGELDAFRDVYTSQQVATKTGRRRSDRNLSLDNSDASDAPNGSGPSPLNSADI